MQEKIMSYNKKINVNKAILSTAQFIHFDIEYLYSKHQLKIHNRQNYSIYLRYMINVSHYVRGIL